MAALKKLIVAWVLAVFTVSAFASFPVPVYWRVGSTMASQDATIDGSCIKFKNAVAPSWTYNSAAFVSSSQYNCTYNAPNYVYYLTTKVSACPANSTGTSTCTCNSGYEEGGNSTCVVAGTGFHSDAACGLYKGVEDGLYVAPYVPGGADSLGSPNGYYTHLCTQTTSKGVILPGCGLTVVYDIATSDGAGGYTKQGTGTFTGSACTMDSTSLGTSATSAYTQASGIAAVAKSDPCPVGSAPGTVNGVSVCAPLADLNVIMADTKVSNTTGATGTAIDPMAPASATGKSTSTTCSGAQSPRARMTCCTYPC